MIEKYAVVEYIPTFVETDKKPEIGTFSSEEELRTIPFVVHFTKNLHGGFVRFSRAGPDLMAEYQDGFYWPVGILRGHPPFLPEWVAPKEGE